MGSIPGRTQLGPLDDLVSGKLAIIEQSLKQVYEEIEARQKIHGSLIEELDREHCRQMEALRQVAPHGSSLFTIGDLRRRSGLEKELAALENEKRHEQVAVWKDVGSDRFLSRLEGMLGRSVRPRPIGRPKGWRKKK